MRSQLKAILFVIALWALALAYAAPVPKVRPKPTPPPSVLGTWESCWSVWGSEMHFAVDGTYYHKYKGSGGGLYVGTWWELKDGTLVVREQYIDSNPAIPPGDWITWSTVQWWSGGIVCEGTTTGGYGNVLWGVRDRKPGDR